MHKSSCNEKKKKNLTIVLSARKKISFLAIFFFFFVSILILFDSKVFTQFVLISIVISNFNNVLHLIFRFITIQFQITYCYFFLFGRKGKFAVWWKIDKLIFKNKLISNSLWKKIDSFYRDFQIFFFCCLLKKNFTWKKMIYGFIKFLKPLNLMMLEVFKCFSNDLKKRKKRLCLKILTHTFFFFFYLKKISFDPNRQ